MTTEQLLSFDIKKNKAAQKKIEETIAKLKMSGTAEEEAALETLQRRKATMDGLLKMTIDEASQAQATQQIGEKTLETLGMSVSSLKYEKGNSVGRWYECNPYMLLLARIKLINNVLKVTVSFSMKLSKNWEYLLDGDEANTEIGFVRRKFLDMVGIDVSCYFKSVIRRFWWCK